MSKETLDAKIQREYRQSLQLSKYTIRKLSLRKFPNKDKKEEFEDALVIVDREINKALGELSNLI